MLRLAPQILGRAAAAVAALGWGLGVLGLLLPSESAFAWLRGLGAEGLEYHPLLDYWLRMTAYAFTFLALQFFAVTLAWTRLRPLAWALTVFQLSCGAVLLISAQRIALETGNHRADAAFCLASGGLLLVALLAERVSVPPSAPR